METATPIKIFGHEAPDTDTVVSAIVYAWYHREVLKQEAEPFVLGELNRETEYVLDRFEVAEPERLGELSAKDQVIVVDTNNVDELPDTLHDAELLEIVDHHKLSGGITTTTPVTITMRPMASTASLIYTLINPELHELPPAMAGLMLAGLLSDTLEFRSPTTTAEDREIADELARIAGVDVSELAEAMFAAKSDLSDIAAETLVTLDSKVFEIKGQSIRVSVLETTDPAQVMQKREELIEAMQAHVAATEVDEVLLFAIDILNEEALPIVGSAAAKAMIEGAFAITLDEETALPGVVSRKKQIIPRLMA